MEINSLEKIKQDSSLHYLSLKVKLCLSNHVSPVPRFNYNTLSPNMEENFWGASIKQSGPGVTQRFQDLLGWPCISKASEADKHRATCQDFHFWAFVFLLDRKAYALFLQKKKKNPW